MKTKLEKFLIDISLKIAKSGKGCLFVIMKNKIPYKPFINQDIKPFNIFNNERRLFALANLDGACIINEKGILISYSSNILNIRTFKKFGSRHSAGYTASFNENTSILASEEDKKVRIFKNGRLIMQIDSLEKNIENKTSQAASILESIGVGSLTSIGISMLAPAIGITIVSGIILFGTSHYLINRLVNHKKD